MPFDCTGVLWKQASSRVVVHCSYTAFKTRCSPGQQSLLPLGDLSNIVFLLVLLPSHACKMMVWVGLTDSLASLDCWVAFLVRNSMEYTEYVLGLLVTPFHSSTAILLECLQNVFLLDFFALGSAALLSVLTL